jgi:hypothetical protein
MEQPVHVTFIHGLSNKPRCEELRRIWLEALACPTDTDVGLDLGEVGIKDSFVYWADLFYDKPLSSAEYENANVSNRISDGLEEPNTSLPENEWIAAIRNRFPDADDSIDDPPVATAPAGYERIPLPGVLKRMIMAEFLREAHAYLFNVDGIRDTIRARVLEDLSRIPEGTKKILVGHSQGTFIAYDVMTGIPDCPPIDGFMTIGSPLGVDEVQDRLVWTRGNGFPEKLRHAWVNIYDPFDFVARLDPRLANDFRRLGKEVVIDIKEENWGSWRHSATKYFKGSRLRTALRKLCF